MVLTPTGVEPIDSLQTLFDEWYGTINADSERVEEDGIKVYPNPSRGLLNIVLPPSVKLPAGASIFDSKGSVLKTTTLQSRSNQLALPESWANEVLFLKISDEQGRVVYSEKLLVLPHD